MKIINNINGNQTFKAKHIATTITKAGKNEHVINLFSLDKNDQKFGYKLLEKIDLDKLYPEVENKENFISWKTLIMAAIAMIGRQNVVLAVRDKRPCGIMSYDADGEGGINLSYLAKWRVKASDDTYHIGKALVHHLLSEAQNLKAEYVSLIPFGFSPRGKSSKTFYESIGFHEMENRSHMVIPDFAFQVRAAQLENFFTKTQKGDGREVDADKNFSLNFYETLSEKLFKN